MSRDGTVFGWWTSFIDGIGVWVGCFPAHPVSGRAKKARQAVWDGGATNNVSTVEGRWKPRLLDSALLLVLRRVRKRRGIGSAAGEVVLAA